MDVNLGNQLFFISPILKPGINCINNPPPKKKKKKKTYLYIYTHFIFHEPHIISLNLSFNPNYSKSIKIHHLVLLLHGIAHRIEHVHVAMCTNSIKLSPAAFVGFRTVCIAKPWMHLLLYQIHQTPPAAFDGFRIVYIAKPWMLCICYCTNSIKLHPLLLLDSGLCV